MNEIDEVVSYRKYIQSSENSRLMHLEKMTLIALDIRRFLKERKLWDGTNSRIYFNNIVLDSRTVDIIENINPKDDFEFANMETVCVSFKDCPLYDALNYGDYNPKTEWYSWDTSDELDELIEKYGYFKEMGHSWNFSIFEL